MSAQTVTVGLPVYRGESFIEEALQTLQRQTYPHFKAVISLDGPDAGCEELCRPFLSDSRFQLFVQPERLGWVGNLNWLMAHTETPWWMYHQQDDVLDPHCLNVLMEHARKAPEAAVVYGDIEAFGSYSGTFVQTSVTGTAQARQLALLYEHQAGVAFRGLTRSDALAGGIPHNEVDDFAAEIVWMAVAARFGELRRVPQTLSRKRYHDDNVHTKWDLWPVEKRIKAWTLHCAAMLGQAMLVEAAASDRRLLWLAAVGRLTSLRTAARYIPIAAMGAPERAALLDAFFDCVRTTKGIDITALLDARWDDVCEWTTAFVERREP